MNWFSRILYRLRILFRDAPCPDCGYRIGERSNRHSEPKTTA